MKTKEDLRQLTTTQTNFSKALGVTPQRVRQLIIEGVVKRDERDDSGAVYVFESLRNYYQNRRVGSEQRDVDFDSEHALLEQIKRKTAELKLQKARGELYEASVVEQVITQDLVKIRTQLLSLPIKITPELEGKSKEEISEILTREIENILMELSNTDVKTFYIEEMTNEES